MDVLVSGATGLVGAHTAAALYRAGHRLRLLVRDRQRAECWCASQDIVVSEWFEGDMSDRALARRALQGCDAVVHAAAAVNLQRAEAEQTLRSNLAGVENIVGEAWKMGIPRILYVSSAAVLMHPNAQYLREDGELNPGGEPYSVAKRACEDRVRDWQCQGAPIIISYPSAVFGPHDPKLSESNAALCTFYNSFVPQTRSGMQFVDARDLADAHRLLLEKPMNGNPCNERYLVAGHFLPWRAFADLLASQRPVRRLPLPAWLLMSAGRFLDACRHVITVDFPLSREAARIVCHFPPSRSQRLRDALAFEYRPAADTVHDTVCWLEQCGHLTPVNNNHNKRTHHV